MCILPRLSLSVLILAFALLGVARAAVPAAGDVRMIAICSESGAISIAVDSNGRPVDQTPHCLCVDCCDCAQVAGFDLPRDVQTPIRQTATTDAPSYTENATLPCRRPVMGQPRGPPQPDIET